MGARVKFTHEPHFLAIVFELVVKAIEVSGVCLSAGAKRQHSYQDKHTPESQTLDFYRVI